ncbi:hypothetical protein [Sphingopyxis sp.]|jgi:hypothetical protein|uniref:hypothetical protein n=1 Tax=Sphingopyxis sp. TaxID=1908224 RepID=UPI003F6EC6D1
MLIQPIWIREPEIRALVGGTMSVLIRPVGRLAVLDPGDLLWVREPFHLAQRFAGHAPTHAARLGAAPIFVADRTPAQLAIRSAELGDRRNAREMPKVWHRQHLRVVAIDRLHLHDVDLSNLAIAGWDSAKAYRERWDEDARFFGARINQSNFWAANPPVLRIEFERIPAPLPQEGD